MHKMYNITATIYLKKNCVMHDSPYFCHIIKLYFLLCTQYKTTDLKLSFRTNACYSNKTIVNSDQVSLTIVRFVNRLYKINYVTIEIVFSVK